MSGLYTQNDIDDIENNLLEAEANLQTYVSGAEQMFRTNALYRMNPWMADTPETVMTMAAMQDVSTNDLLNNAAVSYGMMRASTLADDLRNKLPSTQRAIFSTLSPAQQANLIKMGYEVPKMNATTKSWYDGPLGTATAPFRWSISDVAIPAGAQLLKGFMFAQDQVYQRPLRTISQLNTASKISAGVGAGVGFYLAGSAALAATSFGPFGLAVVAGTGALVGATATAFLSETLQGNPMNFWNTFVRAGDGEKFFTNQSINRATELLGDETLQKLAQTFARELGNETDLISLVKEVAGVRGGLNQEQQFEKIQKIAAGIVDPTSPTYFETVAALETIIQQPIFQEAVTTLQQGKVSAGRIAARSLGLNPNSSSYQFVSGFVDGVYMMTMDPIMLLSYGTKAYKAIHNGMEFADGAVMSNKFKNMYENRKSVQRVFDTIAKGVVNGDTRLIKRYTPQWFPLYDNMRTYYNMVSQTADFTGFTGKNVVDFISDGQRFSSIMQGLGITQGVTRQTLKTLGPVNYALRTATGALGDFLRAAGDTNIYRLAEKISDNPNFMDDVIRGLPEEVQNDFYLLTQTGPYKAGKAVAEIPIAGRIVQVFGAAKETLITPALTKSAISVIDKLDATQDITTLVRSFNQIGLTSVLQDIWIKTIIDNPDFKGRINAIASLIDSLATAGNLRQTSKGAEVIDGFLTHFKQHYAFGKAGTMSTEHGALNIDKVGALPVLHNQAIMIAVPDMKELRKATANGTWFRYLLNIPENQYIEAFQSKIWKPAVLFKYGFALRNSGEDLLATFARAGSGFWLQEFAGRNIGNYDAYQESYKVAQRFDEAVNLGRAPKLTARQKWILAKDYDIPTHIRPFARVLTRWGQAKDPTFVIGKNYGKWLTTFLRGENRQQSTLVEVMKYLRTGQTEITSRGIAESLSLSPDIIKSNVKAISDLMIFGNEFSLRRMLVGGVDKRKIQAGRYFVEDSFTALMDRLGTGSGLPFDLGLDRAAALERGIGDKVNMRLVNGEMGVVRQGENTHLLQDHHVSVHERTSELSDDALMAPVKQMALFAFTPDIQEIVSPPEFKEIINAWKNYLNSAPDGLGSLDPSTLQLWTVINEPLRATEPARRYNAVLNQLKGTDLYDVLKSRFGGIRVPTPDEFMEILVSLKSNDVGVSALADLHKLVGNIEEPAKTWVMANIYQDWAENGQHFGPEVMRWNGQSVGRSKGHPLYRMMQRPGDQYVINPDGSITLFFQEQAQWGSNADALSFSLSHEQSLRYAQGIDNAAFIKTRPVMFTTTVDDTFAAHGITKENIGWRDYDQLYSNVPSLPYRDIEGKGATFVQAPEGPYVLESPDFRNTGLISHRELALHAEKPKIYIQAEREISKLQHAQTEQEILLTRLETLYAESEPGTLDRTLFDQYTARLKEVEENIERSKDVIIAAGLDPANPIIPKTQNSITYPAGTYSLHVPDGSIYDDIGQDAIDELWRDTWIKSETKTKEVFSKPGLVDEFNIYFKNFSFKYGTDSADLEILDINIVENVLLDPELEFVFPNINASVLENGDTGYVPRIFANYGREHWEYVDDLKYPPIPPSFDGIGNVIKIRIDPKSLIQLISEEMNIMNSSERVAELGRTLRTINYEFPSLSNEYKKLDSLRATKGYVNNINDPLGPESSRIAHLLTDEDFKYYTKQIDDLYYYGEETLRSQISLRDWEPEKITNQQRYEALSEQQQYSFKIASEQLNQHNLIKTGQMKPGEIFADYSTSPFYSSFDEIQPAMEMEMARMIESGEFDDAMNLNRRVVDTGPTQEVFVLDTSNLPPYIAKNTQGELPELNSPSGLNDYFTATRTKQIGDTWNPGVDVNRSPLNIEELVLSAIDTRTPLVFSTRESAEFYLDQMNALLEKMTPYKPKGNVARNLEQQYFIPEVKSMYLPVKEPDEIVQLNEIFGFATENSQIPTARKMFSMKSKAEIKIQNPDFVGNMPEEAFDVIGWPVDNYPIVSEYLYDAATQGSQKQIIDAAIETIKQRVKSGRHIEYTVRNGDSVWILNEGRPMLLEAGDVIPTTKMFSDPRMADDDLINLGDMRFMEESPITYRGEEDINWNIIAPLLYDDAEKIAGRKLYEGTTSTRLNGEAKEIYLDHTPVTRFTLEDVQNSSAASLPNLEIASVWEDIPSGAMANWDKAVQVGFGKVLGPVMDAISRKPMAFHAYSIALEQNLKNIDWMLFNTPEEIALNGLADLFHSKNIFGPQSPQTLTRWTDVGRQVGLAHGMPEAEFWSAGEAISYIRSFADEEFDLAVTVLKNNPVDNKTKALVNFANKNKGNVITGDREIGGSWDFLDYMTAQLGEDVIKSGGAEWAVRQRIKEIETVGVEGTSKAKVNKLLDELTSDDFATLKTAWGTREKAFENARFYAQERTIRDTMPYIDSHEIRSQFADYGRGFMPFFYAEENFIKRWARIAALDSGTNGLATLRKFQLQYTGLREMGIIRKSETGEDYFIMPGTDLFIDALSSISGANIGLSGMLTQPVGKMLPGIGPKFGAPSYSPLVIMPLSFIAGRFPDFEPLQALERNIIGEDNALDRNWWDHVLPTSLVNTWKAIRLTKASQDEMRQDEKLSNHLNTAMAHLVAQGRGLKENATASEKEEFLRDATNYARVVEISRLLGGWFGMAPVGAEVNVAGSNSISWLTGGVIENPADLLSSQYYDSIRIYGIDDGTVRYMETYKDSGKRFGIEDIFNPLAYTVGNTETVSGATIPTTKAAIQYYLDNKNILGEYRLGGAWMIPGDAVSDNDFSQWAWNQSVTEGLRVRRTPEEALNEIMFREGATVYFSKKDEYEQNALIAQQNGDEETAKIWQDKWDRFATGWKSANPVFAEVLGDTSRAVKRRAVIDEIQIMLKDPEFPKTDYSESMKTFINGWNDYMNTVGLLSLDKTTAGRTQVATERYNWQTAAEKFVAEVPQLKSFWLSILKPESGLD